MGGSMVTGSLKPYKVRIRTESARVGNCHLTVYPGAHKH